MRTRTTLTGALCALTLLSGTLRAQDKLEQGDYDIGQSERAKRDNLFEEAMRLRQKAIDKGNAYAPDDFPILEHDQAVRTVYWNLSDNYWSAIADGAPKDHKRVKAAWAYLTSCREACEKAGVVLLLKEDDPSLTTAEGVDTDEMKRWSGYNESAVKSKQLERHTESRLYGVYQRAWEGALKAKALDYDGAYSELEAANRMLERELKDKVSAERHILFTRTREAMAPHLAAIEKAYQEISAKREAAEKNLRELDEHLSAMRQIKNDMSRAESDVERLQEQASRCRAFEKEKLPAIRTCLKEFEAMHGTSKEAVHESFTKLYDSVKGRSTPEGSSDYEEFKGLFQEVGRPGAILAKGIVESLQQEVSFVDSYAEDIRTKQVLALIPKVELAMELDPESAEARAMKEALLSKAKGVEEQLKEAAKAARMPASSYPGSDGPEIEAAIIEMLSKSDGWGQATEKRREPVAVVLVSDWFVNERNILGNPIQYGIEAEVAMRHDPSTGWEREEWRVYSFSFYTEEGTETVKGPPFDSYSVGSGYQILPENLPAGSRGGGGSIIGVCIGFSCCFFFLLAGAGGGYFAYQQTLKNKAAAAPPGGQAPPPAPQA